MYSSPWRQWLKRFPTIQRPPHRRRKSFLHLEPLEQRWLPTITATPQTVLLHEGVSNNVVVATFTDSDPSPVNDYSVSINWGDQSALDTTSARVSLSGSTYFVTASHAYAEETPTGTPNAVTVTIQEANGADTDMATVNSSANVADNSLTATATTISGIEGSATTPRVVATFTDADPNGTLSDYSAFVSWGPGVSLPAKSSPGRAVHSTCWQPMATRKVLILIR